MPDTSAAERKRLAQSQFARSAAAYVVSKTHAAGADLERMIELADPRPADRALDVATGGGHVARALIGRVREIVVADLTLEMLRAALDFLKSAGANQLHAVITDAEAMPLATGAFDLVTCRIAPHHFPLPERFVEEVARVLAPGGRFALVDSTVPEGEVGEFFNEFERLRDLSHVRSLTIREWEELIRAAGLTLLATETFPKRHDFDDWTARMRVSPDTKAELTRRMREAPAEVHATYQPEWEGERLVAFTDTKTLFVALRP